MKMTVHPHSFRRSGASRQRGMVLMLVLIVLGILALAGAAVMRSVDSGNTIAGNHAIQQTAMQASEQAVAAAIAYVPTVVAAGNANVNEANRYFATRQTGALDARGFPTNINWDAVNCVDERGVSVTGTCDQADGGYKVQWVVERLCSATPTGTVQNLRAVCEHDVETAGISATLVRHVPVHFRVIVRVRGPRNVDMWYEALIAGPTST